ncbi:DUF4493 domain-containing protein [Parabacteroides sp. W1-Q-101]|uniref:DUF4493 domain-containing protein n=1 Tax=Parabacteroides TaxID=375288 RepID=UPI00202E834B|nr:MULTISPECIES: DUF4493 domain-containing protein [Parabacteroides]MCM0716961.1 DUF4493 domain-containing protein [Parabacteroides sp. W1-Q-101]
MEIKRRHSSARAMALFTYISVLILSLSACDEEGHSSKSGKLRLSLTADTTSLKKGIDSGITKAASDEFAQFLTTEDYRILIVTDKDTTKSYDRFDQMPSEIELPEGAYTLVASKGNNLPAEFENPYFEGSTAFTVKEGMSTPLEVTATLGNARITAEYTDDFKEAYSEYAVLLSSAYTTTDLEIAKGETRPAYMQVDKEGTDIAIGIKLKKITEETEKTYYVPTALKLERRQNVRLIFKTDGEALEGIGLDIVLDDTMEEVTFTTEIPDFMWKPFDKPTLSAAGFEDGASLEVKTSAFDEDLRVGFNIPGGMKSLSVKRWIGDEEEEDAESLDLVAQADEALKQGYCWMVGETENGSLSNARAGYISLLKAIRSLQADPDNPVTYHFVFQAVDATGKAYESNTLRLTVVVQPAGAPFIDEQALALPSEAVEGDELVDVLQASIIAEGLIDEEHTTLTLASTGGLNDIFRLTNDDERKKLYETYGIGVEKIADSRLDLYVFKPFTTFLTAPAEGGSTTYSLKLHLQDKNGKTDEVTKEIVVKAPEFELVTGEGDAFAKRIVLRTNFLGGEDKNKLTYQYLNGSDWTDLPNQSLKKDADGNQWVDTLRSLMPETKYSVRAIYNRGKDYERISKEVTVTTETTGTIPNGGFEEWSIAPDANGNTDEGAKNTITVTGKSEYPYRYWELWQPWSSSENIGWATLNALTTQHGSMNEGWVTAGGDYGWTRYAANSGTIKAEGVSGSAALIRTVGWGAGNTGGGDASVIKEITPGELFLGEVNSNTLKPIYGYDFGSRPTGISFDYKYETKSGGDDTFIAEIVVLGANGEIVTQQQLPKSESGAMSSWFEGKQIRLQYTGENGRLKAEKIYIRFKSSTSDNYDYLRSNLVKMPPFSNLSNGESVGSQLYIDNVELIYE